ncbi:MAG: 50S ribosomal protein L9 [candidate division TM6 bacterium GW2011_GWE2_41_16]|nr:MAG: 50S ribosomal protein L9 [candidate division TM6 bacterium GW2011_GWE2_41_16]
MKVYMLKDLENVGAAGEIVKVAEGYACNFLIPRKYAVQLTLANESSYVKKAKTIENRKEVIATKTSLLAQKISAIEIKIARPLHDDGKLYGTVSAQEVVDKLADLGVNVSKNQIIFNKNIKEKGAHKVTVKLSSQLQPIMTVTIVGAK